jgi:hypothetical protein
MVMVTELHHHHQESGAPLIGIRNIDSNSLHFKNGKYN